MTPLASAEAVLWKAFAGAMGVVVALIGSVWALTWKATDRKATQALDNTNKLNEFCAAQHEINRSMDDKLDMILGMMRRNGRKH